MKKMVEPILDRYFEYEKIFNLFYYTENMENLYRELRPLVRSAYPANYRFVFSHYDTDYYITKQQPGLLLRNLQKILWNLGISNYFCLVLSQQNLQPELDQLRMEETTDEVSIACITHAVQDLMHMPKMTDDINTSDISKHYICLNRLPRFHRLMTFNLLQQRGLLDKGLVSFGIR